MRHPPRIAEAGRLHVGLLRFLRSGIVRDTAGLRRTQQSVRHRRVLSRFVHGSSNRGAGADDSSQAKAPAGPRRDRHLDVVVPGVDGLEVCRRLPAAGDKVPVLMVTALDAVADRVAGLDAGPDDYVVKPFSIEELRARMRALLRRAGLGDSSEPAQFPDLALDPRGHQVFRGERRVELTRREFQLLELFMRNVGQVLTRAVIFDRVWDTCTGPSRRRPRTRDRSPGRRGTRRHCGGE